MSKTQVINEFDYGVMVWYTTDGRLVQNEDGDIMYISINNIKDKKEVTEKARALRAAAASFGFVGGTPNFWSGNRPVSDEEYENQKQRQDAGLIPDMWDQGAINDEMRTKKK